MFPFVYTLALYRRNNFGQPCVWYAEPFDHETFYVYHGIVGKTITKELIRTHRSVKDEIDSRIKAKRKTGYKLLGELKDNVQFPVEGELLSYLQAYLPTDRTTVDGTLLPMLAKAYDNTNNKLFKKTTRYFAQWKINGLRCFVSAERNVGDLFKPTNLRFQSREGTYWTSLPWLEEYLLSVLDNKLLDKMIEEHYILDGEVYLPGHSVNEINHFVKDVTAPENKLLQYWCYDIAIDNTCQSNRIEILQRLNVGHVKVFVDKNTHLNNTERFVVLPSVKCDNDAEAVGLRDAFIDCGFEGLILRNPDAEYQYGKRNQSMIKFKRATDGRFKIVDIYPEGIRRKDIPLILCKNDINDATFEVHLSAPMEYQKQVLIHKDEHIGKHVWIVYGERSGVNNVPFHVKDVRLLG